MLGLEIFAAGVCVNDCRRLQSGVFLKRVGVNWGVPGAVVRKPASEGTGWPPKNEGLALADSRIGRRDVWRRKRLKSGAM